MYRRLFQRCWPACSLPKDVSTPLRRPFNRLVVHNESRCLTISAHLYKKRKSVEERAIENSGRRVIRYSKGDSRVVGIWRNMTVQDISKVIEKDIEHVLDALEFADKTSNTRYNKNTVISNPQIIRDVVKICGFRSKTIPNPDEEITAVEDKDAYPAPPAPPDRLRPRPPVVCVMGHVDHGKTTLLDALRNTSVVEQEFGGITQHIGAFEVSLQTGDKVTFLDTPGHAAFTSMRSRGARATDIVVLVVAADDGVMEQTVESIRMAREARVPILVAINKIDKPGVNIDRTMHALAAHGVVCEAIGGDVQAIPISALKRTNLDILVEALTVQAQMMELKADPTGLVEGVVIEAFVDPKKGKQATVLVQRGTLTRGAIIVAGLGWAKVRTLSAAHGGAVEVAGPSTPVSVLGWRALPAAGNYVIQVPTEKRAAEVLRWREDLRAKEKQAADQTAIQEKETEHQLTYKAQLQKKRSMGRFRLRPEGPRQKMIVEDEHPTLSVVVKGDVDGSVEAILDILETYDEDDKVRLDLVHFGVGQVTPSDIEIAEAFNAVIYAFNVECPPAVLVEAKSKNIQIHKHNVIYKLVDDMKEEINSRIPTTQVEEIIGEANVLQQFLVSEGRKKVPVAGCRCLKGNLSRNALYRVIRGQDIVYEGKLSSMKHLKDEVNTVKCDQECGLKFEDSSFEIKAGDTIVCYKMVDASVKTDWDPGF